MYRTKVKKLKKRLAATSVEDIHNDDELYLFAYARELAEWALLQQCKVPKNPRIPHGPRSGEKVNFLHNYDGTTATRTGRS